MENITFGKEVAIILIVHAIYLLLGQKQLFDQMIADTSRVKAITFLLVNSLPIILSSLAFIIFALNFLIKKILILRLLIFAILLSWLSCLGWFFAEKIFDKKNDWFVFCSPVFIFPLFLLWFYRRQLEVKSK